MQLPGRGRGLQRLRRGSGRINTRAEAHRAEMRPYGQQQRDPPRRIRDQLPGDPPRRIRDQLPGDPPPDPDAVPGDQLQQLPEILDVQQVDPEQLPGLYTDGGKDVDKKRTK